jgi:type II secretory pathway pseudopilin PulG
MNALETIVLIIVVVLALLVAGGLIASDRRAKAGRGELRRRLREADRALADARAQDRGWERSVMEAAVREAFAQRSPAEPQELLLLQVLDRPGIDDDEAIFRVVTDAGAEDVHLVRRAGDWVAG